MSTEKYMSTLVPNRNSRKREINPPVQQQQTSTKKCQHIEEKMPTLFPPGNKIKIVYSRENQH